MSLALPWRMRITQFQLHTTSQTQWITQGHLTGEILNRQPGSAIHIA